MRVIDPKFLEDLKVAYEQDTWQHCDDGVQFSG